MRIPAEIRAGDDEGVEDDAGNRAAAHPCGEAVSQLMDRHHAEPGEEDDGNDEEKLKKTVHKNMRLVSPTYLIIHPFFSGKSEHSGVEKRPSHIV